MSDEQKISTLCAWCKDWVYKADEDHAKDDFAVSHGICDPCHTKLDAEMEELRDDS